MDGFIEIPRELIDNNPELILCMDIMFFSQQTLFTTIEKGVWFQGLVPLANRTKEECYRDLGLVIINYKKTVFVVKCIECDGKFKTIMDEVSNDMGIEMNDSNKYDHVPEAERNNRVIKERF